MESHLGIRAPSWLKNSSLAILDQALQGAATFSFTIIAARDVSAEQFGLFGVLWSIVMLVDGVSTALLADPLYAIVARRRGAVKRKTLGAALVIGAMCSISLSILVSPVLLLGFAYSTTAICLFVACAFVFRLQQLFRRVGYIANNLKAPVLASLTYAITLVTLPSFFGVGASALELFFVWFLSSAAASMVGLLQVHSELGWPTRRHLGRLTFASFRTGKWLFGGSVAYWLSSQGAVTFAAVLVGIEQAGYLRALMNLISPVTQLFAAISAYATPRVAENNVTKGMASSVLLSGQLSILFVGSALFYCLAIVLFLDWIAVDVYLDAGLLAYRSVLLILIILCLADAARSALCVCLIAMGRTRTIFFSRLIGLLAMFSVLLAFVGNGTLLTVAVAMAVGGVFTTLVIGAYLVKTYRVVRVTT